jgi:hypothetical protein
LIEKASLIKKSLIKRSLIKNKSLIKKSLLKHFGNKVKIQSGNLKEILDTNNL